MQYPRSVLVTWDASFEQLDAGRGNRVSDVAKLRPKAVPIAKSCQLLLWSAFQRWEADRYGCVHGSMFH
jgi:hypothetical protein